MSITYLPGADIPADEVLERAQGKLDAVIIVGEDHDGKFYFSGTTADAQRISWLLRLADDWLMDEIKSE